MGVSVWNDGDGPSEATTLRIYRSVDTTVDASDTQVDTAPVAELAASENASTTIRVRSPLSPGNYYYGACVDAVAGESDTTNNCGGSVAVPVVPRGQPDLVVETPIFAPPFPTAGATFTLTATVWNFAQVVDGTSEATTLRYYRSVDGTVTTSDTQVGTDTVPALGPRGRSTQSVELTAPSTPGTYYYAACVDAVTDESDTTNNCSNRRRLNVREPEQSTLSVEVSAPQEWAPVGDTVTYTARVVDSEGEEMSGYTFSWTSSDTTKATVASSGVVTAVAVGEATISASASATASSSSARDFGPRPRHSRSILSGSLKMDVVKPVARIELSPGSLSFDAVGEWETVTATLYDADGNEMRPTYWGYRTRRMRKWWMCTTESHWVRCVGERVLSIGEGSTTVIAQRQRDQGIHGA